MAERRPNEPGMIGVPVAAPVDIFADQLCELIIVLIGRYGFYRVCHYWLVLSPEHEALAPNV